MDRFEHDDTLRCYHCGNVVPMKVIGRDVPTWEEGSGYIGVEEWSFYMCPICKAPTLMCYYWQQKGKKITSEIGKSIVYPNNIFNEKHVPENIRNAYRAATVTRFLDKPISLMAWRRVLELICNDLKAEGKNLYEKIVFLSENNRLPLQLQTASQLIRNLGNDGAHGSGQKIEQVDVLKVESLVRYIIEYIYILPEKMNVIFFDEVRHEEKNNWNKKGKEEK